MNKSVNDYYFRVTDIWKRFCEEHTKLLDLTFEEYSHLLSSDVDELENVLERKAEVIDRIKYLEKARTQLITNLNELVSKEGSEPIKSVSQLINFMSNVDSEKEQNHLSKFNALLIDVIDKLKSQNKKNQLFLNKAISSLKNIKNEAYGIKSFSTYGPEGRSVSNKVP